MASKRRLRRRTCAHKVAHRDRDSALLACKRTPHPVGRPLAPYRCKFCGQWHVGRMSRDRGNLKLWSTSQ